MPLDSSGVTPIFGRKADGESAPVREKPSLDYGPDIGVALKAAREYRGMSIQDVADEPVRLLHERREHARPRSLVDTEGRSRRRD